MNGRSQVTSAAPWWRGRSAWPHESPLQVEPVPPTHRHVQQHTPRPPTVLRGEQTLHAGERLRRYR